MDSGTLLLLLRRKNGFVSGEELSEKLGVSRTAVWKHIHLLEAAGYVIEAVPHRGYRMISVPDQLLPDEILFDLATRVFGREIYCYSETTSTNDRAMALAQDGLPEGTLVAAEYQTQGRGRREHTWVSQAGKNLLFSIIFRPPWVAEQGALMTLLMATAVARAIRSTCGIEVMIKWPNDILCKGKKLAGVLTEMQAQTDKIAFLVCGVGINVNHSPFGTMRYPTTSLAAENKEMVLRIPLLKNILSEVEMLYNTALEGGLSTVVDAWQALSYLQAKRVCVEQPHGRIWEGVVQGVSGNGALRVKLDDGRIETLITGEVAAMHEHPLGGKGRKKC